MDNNNTEHTNDNDIVSGSDYSETLRKDIEDIDTGRNDEDDTKNIKIVKSHRNGCFFSMIWIVMLIFISILITRYILTGINDMLAIGRDNTIATVEIPKDANINTVAKTLKDKGVISEPAFFKLYAMITKSTKGFSQGVYEIKRDMDYEAVLSHIRNKSNNKDVVEITFREGMSILEYANLLEEKSVCGKGEFLSLCNSDQFDETYDFLKGIKNKSDRYYKLEGYLFPDTYEFYRGENAADTIQRFLKNFDKRVIKKNAIKGYDDKISIKELCENSGKSLDQILNIASMIQAEAANNDDMYNVSSVIYNRLKAHASGGKNQFGEYGLGLLGIDSTVWYPYRTKATVPTDMVNSFKSRYDTYSIEGLPPGPICNPGIEAILAALKPSNTQYYYFCHSLSGQSYYAKTNDVHLSNLRKAGLI